MRNNTTRKRVLALTVLLAGAAAMTVALIMPDSAGRTFMQQTGLLGVLRGALLFVGFAACGGGILTLLALLLSGPSQSPALKRGERPIARWTVDAETWRAFVELNAALDRQKGAVRNLVPRNDLPTTTGVEIVVAPDGVCVGPDFYAIPTLSAEDAFYWLPGPPQYFELRTIIRSSSIHRFLLRFPVARGAQDQAVLARTHFASLREPPPPPETLRRWRNIALVIACVSLVAFAGAHLIIPMVESRGSLEMLLNIVYDFAPTTLIMSLLSAVILQRILVGSRPRK